MSADQIMSEHALAEPEGHASVLRKRKRGAGVESLEEDIAQMEAALDLKFDCPDGEPGDPVHPLEDHPSYDFYSRVAGTIPDTHVDDLIRIPTNAGDAREKHERAVRKCAAAHTALMEILGNAHLALQVAKDLQEDFPVARNVRGILNSLGTATSTRLLQLQLLYDVREYLSGTTSNYSKAEALYERAKNMFNLDDTDDYDLGLALWLRSEGDSLLRGDMLVQGNGDGGEESGEAGDDSAFSAQKDKPSGPSAVGKMVETATNQQLGTDSQGSSGRRSAASQGSSGRTRRRPDFSIFSTNADYYVNLDDIREQMDSLRAGERAIQLLRGIMRDFDEEYQTSKPEDGAWQWLTVREREVASAAAALRQKTRQIRAAHDLFQRAAADLIKYTDILARARDVPPQDPLPVTEEIMFSVQQARTYVETTNREGFSNVTKEALMSGDETVKTTFAYMVGLMILRTRLQYPDRYRPVMTAMKIEEELTNSAVFLADYEYISGRVRKRR